MRYIPIEEIPKYRGLLPRLVHPRVARVCTSILHRLATVLGHRLFWLLPEHLEQYAGNDDAQRALRIIGRLLRTGDLTNSSIYQTNHPDEPPSYISFLTIDDEEKALMGWSGKSVHLFDQSKTFWPALGEALERRCSILPFYAKGSVIECSFATLHRPKVDIFDIAGLTDERRAKGNTLYELVYDADSVFSWLPTTELTTRTTVYAPLQWFSFAHVNKKLHKTHCHGVVEPLLTAPITTGAAAGQTQDDAILGGLLEVIERDAFIIYWLNQLQADRIDLTCIDNEEIAELLTIAKDYRLEVHMLYLKTDVPVHTISLVLLDRTGIGPAVMVSAKTGYDLIEMCISILHDSLGQHYSARNLRDTRALTPEELKPDRLGHEARMIYWHDLAQIKKIEHFINGDPRDLSALPQYQSCGTARADLDHLLTWFKHKNYQVYYRELMSPRMRRLTEGMSVAMVKVPKMQPLYLEEPLRSTKGARLRDVPVYLGYPAPPDGPDPFCKEPHPFP